jgi:hypothetical protein
MMWVADSLTSDAMAAIVAARRKSMEKQSLESVTVDTSILLLGEKLKFTLEFNNREGVRDA